MSIIIFRNIRDIACRTFIATLTLLLVSELFFTEFSEARGKGSVYVRGYYRKNGTYVQPHFRSAPDGNPYNNWSFPGNINPYTGKVAPGNPETYLRNYYNLNRSTSSNFLQPSTATQNYNQNQVIQPKFFEPSTFTQTLTKKQVIQLQSFLLLNNFNPGPIDGIYGPKTKHAHKVYLQSLAPTDTLMSKQSFKSQSIRDKIEEILR